MPVSCGFWLKTQANPGTCDPQGLGQFSPSVRQHAQLGPLLIFERYRRKGGLAAFGTATIAIITLAIASVAMALAHVAMAMAHVSRRLASD